MASADTETRAPADAGSASHTAAAPAVELIDLTKYYLGRRAADGTPIPAVDHVNIQIQYGEVYGLLGPNGAGKSTTVRMIATLLAPTSGQVRLCGMDTRTHEREIRAVLGVALGGERSLYWKLTARQNLEYFAALHGQSRRRSRDRIIEVLAEMDLADRADDHIEIWSTGMRQRLVIARALLNKPKVLLLDEPSSGLDPRAAQTMQDHIRALRQAGNTILLTTHDMAEADSLSDRIGIIDKGKVAAEGTPTQLKRSIGASQVVHARITVASAEHLQRIVTDLAGIAEATVDESVPAEGGTAELTLLGRTKEDGPEGPGGAASTDDLVPAVIAVAGRHGGSVLRVENEPVSLKDVFLALTGRRLNGEPDPA